MYCKKCKSGYFDFGTRYSCALVLSSMTKKKGSFRPSHGFFFLESSTSKVEAALVAIGKKVTFDGMPCVSAHCVHFLRLAITKCTLARDSYRHIKTCRWPFPISPLSNHDSGVDRPTQVIVKALAIILH